MASSTGKSFAVCLTELQSGWDNLSSDEKKNTRLRRGGSVYSLANSGTTSGVFVSTTLDGNLIPVLTQYNIKGAKYYTGNINGSALSDKSTSTNDYSLVLELLTYEE